MALMSHYRLVEKNTGESQRIENCFKKLEGIGVCLKHCISVVSDHYHMAFSDRISNIFTLWFLYLTGVIWIYTLQTFVLAFR